jgi:hypothetical protein
VNQPLYSQLAQIVDARLRCLKTPETHREAAGRHTTWLQAIVKRHMPHGAGFDNGTTLDLDASHGERLVFRTSFHHMDESGCYDGWTEHTVTVSPSLAFGFRVAVGGDRNRNQIEDYVADVFHDALSAIEDEHEKRDLAEEAP